VFTGQDLDSGLAEGSTRVLLGPLRQGGAGAAPPAMRGELLEKGSTLCQP
jgi:hypothetical protein